MNKPDKIELFAKYLSDEFHTLESGDGYYLSELWEDLGITNKNLEEIGKFLTERTGTTFNFKEKSIYEILKELT